MGTSTNSMKNGKKAGKPHRTELMETKRREAERDIAGFKEERLKQSLVAENEKYREMASSSYYDPWGKPGGGAPLSRASNSKSKFTDHSGKFGNNVSVTGLFDNMGLQRRGSRSRLSLDPQALEVSQERIKSFRDELRMVRATRAQDQSFEYFDPWGKGVGNPRRSGPDGYVERFQSIKEKGIVPSPRGAQLDFSTDGLRDKNIGVGLSFDNKYGGGGAPAKSRSGNIKTRFPTTMKRDIYGMQGSYITDNAMKEETNGYTSSFSEPSSSRNPSRGTEYFPFGRPGGGAPLTMGDGKVAVQRRGLDFNRELDTSADKSRRKQAMDTYLHDLQTGIKEQRKFREEDRQDQRAPFGELAAVVRQGKIGFPKRDPATGMMANQHLGTSDVTKLKMGNSPSSHAKEYHDDLTRLAEERHATRQREKEKGLEDDNKHNANWSDYWGRPGGGAPNTKEPVFKKHKLEQSIHHLGDNSNSSGAPKLTKTVSSHENNFEVPVDRNQFRPKRLVGVLAPYATT